MMTVFDNIKSKNIDELAKWIDEHFDFDYAPYVMWFDEHYCTKCIAELYTEDNANKCAWCELNGKCKFFKELDNIPDNKDIIKMWLESESK